MVHICKYIQKVSSGAPLEHLKAGSAHSDGGNGIILLGTERAPSVFSLSGTDRGVPDGSKLPGIIHLSGCFVSHYFQLFSVPSFKILYVGMITCIPSPNGVWCLASRRAATSIDQSNSRHRRAQDMPLRCSVRIRKSNPRHPNESM